MKRILWVAAVGLVGACGEDKPTGPTMTELSFLRHDSVSYGVADDAFLAGYLQANANVKVTSTTVKYSTLGQTLLADLKAGKLAYDIVRVQPSWVCTFADQIADVPDDVLTLSEAQNTFFGAPLGGSTCGGKLKGLPVEYNLEYGGVVVNMTKYEAKYGAGMKPSWTNWAAFIQQASELGEYEDPQTKLKPLANGLDIAMEWPQPVKHLLFSQILQRGGNYWAADGTLNLATQQARDSLTAMVDWIAMDKVMHISLIPTMNTFVTNRLAAGSTDYGWKDVTKPLSVMGYVGTWGIPNIKDQLMAGNTTKYEYFTHPPIFGTEQKFVQNSGWAFVVPKTSKNQKAAWQLLKALALSPVEMRKWAATTGALPALKVNGSVEAAAGDPQLAKVQPLLNLGQWVGYIPGGAIETVEGALMSNYFAAVRYKLNPNDPNGKTIEAALMAMQKATNDALAANK